MHEEMYLQISADFSLRNERELQHQYIGFALYDAPRVLASGAVVQIVDFASDFLQEFVQDMAEAEYHFHVRCSGDPEAERWLPSTNAAELTRQIGSLPQRRYPIVCWLVRMRDSESLSLVRHAVRNPEDDNAFAAAVRSGAIWVSLMDIFCDLIAPVSEAGTMAMCIRAAADRTGTPMVWEMWGAHPQGPNQR